MNIEINGLEINFPFEPYLLQREYMTKVIDALNNKQNAVLESPTGRLIISTLKPIKLFVATSKILLTEYFTLRHWKDFMSSHEHSCMACQEKNRGKWLNIVKLFLKTNRVLCLRRSAITSSRINSK